MGQLSGDSVHVEIRVDHGEASQVNVAESRSVNDELRLLELQIKLKEAEAKAKEIGIRQAEAEAKAKEADSENLRLLLRHNMFRDTRQCKFHANLQNVLPQCIESHSFLPGVGRVAPWSFTVEVLVQCSAIAAITVVFLPRCPPTARCTCSPRLALPYVLLVHRLNPGNETSVDVVILFVSDRRSWTRSLPNGASKFSTYACSYCGKPGHKAEFCWTRLQPDTGKPAMIVIEETNTSPVGVMAGLSKADRMPIGLISTKVSVLASRDFDPFQESFAKDPDVGTFRPFLSQSTVEVDGVETLVTILRDSGCLQTLIKEGVVASRKTDKYVVLGFLWGQ
ncbi:hypothetical protein Hamer_G003007, partial [Homarus americanus]